MYKMFASAALLLFAGCSSAGKPPLKPDALAEKNGAAPFEILASFEGQQPTGVTVSDDGRVFVNFPRWREGVVNSVVEVKSDGSYAPFPNADWNQWSGAPKENTFTCVQSVVAHGDSLFVLDPASPELKAVLGQAMLYQFDLKTNQLKKKWAFDAKVAPSRSYLNDLRVDDKRGLIYITESGLGALIVLDMKTGQARRLLDQHASTKSEPIAVYPNGKASTKPNGIPQRFHVDGIEFVDDYVYYHAVTAVNFYRIPAEALANKSLSPKQLAEKIEKLGKTPKPDGLAVDKDKKIYMADLEKNAIVYRSPQGVIAEVVRDPNLHWADTLDIDSKNRLVFSDSRLDQVGPSAPAAGHTFHIYRTQLK